MSYCADIQSAVIDLLTQSGAMRVAVPFVARRPLNLQNEILQAAAKGGGLCAYVYPILPSRVQEDTPFVYVDQGEVRVRILEQPAINQTGANAWQLAEDIALALHWAPKVPDTALGKLVLHPLALAERCQQRVEDKETRLVDVNFHAVYQLSTHPAPAVPFAGDFASAAEGLAACCQAQIAGSLALPVPVLIQRDHDQASQIAAAGKPVKIEILPPVPVSALQGVPFVFYDRYEVRVRITEYPPLNPTGPDVYDLAEEVMAALHWQPFGGFLPHPLQLAAHPTSIKDNLDRREVEVLFNATVGFTE